MGKAGELHRRSQGDTAVVDSVDGGRARGRRSRVERP
jgi:hypothetical protein